MTHRLRLAALVALVAVVAILVLSERVYQALVGVLSGAQGIAAEHPGGAAGLVVLFAALGAMLAFISSWVVVPFAVYNWGAAPALLLLWCGWLLGGAASYALGRFVGRPAIGWLTSPAVIARYEARISHRSTFGMIVLLQLGLPSEIPGYLLGMVRYPFAWYLAALGLAELVHGLPVVLLGAGLLERRAALIVPIAAAMVVLTLSAAYALRRRMTLEKVAEREAPVEPAPA